MKDHEREMFTAEPGYLFVAPLRSTEPENAVGGGVFTDQWPLAEWRAVGVTNPRACAIDTEPTLEVDAWVSHHRWSFGPVLSGRLAALTAAGEFGLAVRFMIGWESARRTHRLLARQCAINGRWVALEADPRYTFYAALDVRLPIG